MVNNNNNCLNAVNPKHGTRLFKNPMLKYWTKAHKGREQPGLKSSDLNSSIQSLSEES